MRWLRRDVSGAVVGFIGAAGHAHAVAEKPLPGVSHYIRGSDPARWLWDVPRYGAVRFPNVYPGVELVYRGTDSNLEFDFLVAAGANPSHIRLRVPARARIDETGSLVLEHGVLKAPQAWQTVGGKQIPVSARFRLSPQSDKRLETEARIELGEYDSRAPLTIDPVIQFATFLGGSGNDIGRRVMAGPDGAIYLAGDTESADFPASFPPDSALNRPVTLLDQTAYLARLAPDASALQWSLFIGGSARQAVFALGQDGFGNVYLLGSTNSPNFPVTQGAWQTTIDPSMTDLFLVKLDAATGHIKASSFLGVAFGRFVDRGASLAIDPAGGIYIGGYILYTNNFKPSAGAFAGAATATSFVLRLNNAMNAAVYATYWPLGSITAMAVDGSGNLTLGGTAGGCAQCGTPPFPAVNPLPGVNQTPTFPAQAYLARLNATGTAVAFATLLQGDGRDSGISDVKMAKDGSMYVAGWTSGTKFPQVNPLMLGPYSSQPQPTPDDLTDSPFLVTLAADGKSLAQSTWFVGVPYSAFVGSALNTNLHLGLQPTGQPCLAGLTIPMDFQTLGGLLPAPPPGAIYAGWSLSCVDPTGTSVNLRTDLPATGGYYTDVATTPEGDFLFTGGALGTFSTTAGVVQQKYGGNPAYRDYYSMTAIPDGDAFLLRVSLANPAPNIQRIVPDFLVVDSSSSGGCSVELTGSGFGYGAAATWSGAPAKYSFIDPAHAILGFDCSLLQTGDNQIGVSLPAPGGGMTQAVLTAINAPPSSISISPSSVMQASGETKLVIRATNLSAASVLYWNGSPRAASFVLDGAGSRTGHFELLLEPPELASPANVQVTVSNPGPGGGTSPVAVFSVQAPGGSGVPVLNALSPVLFSDAQPAPTQVTLEAANLSSSTQAYWDGVEVPVSSVFPTNITIQPPAQDLTHLGEHVVYVTSGGTQSATVRVYVGRALSAAGWAYDPAAKRLYVITAANGNSPSFDLMVLDGATGNLVTSVPGIVSSAGVSALSADGRYLYIATSPPGAAATVARYNTAAGTVDLQWPIAPPPGQTMSAINTLVTPPDSPETVIVATAADQVLIYDRDRPRLYDSISAGFSTSTFGGAYPFFASATRIYAAQSGSPGGTCWAWLDYDAFGISGGQPGCTSEPPETQHDNGVTYLSDGTRVSVISLPAVPSMAFSLTGSTTALDLSRRRAWQFTGSQVFDYAMDAEQLRLRATISSPYSPYGRGSAIYPMDDGSVLVVLSSLAVSVR
jgi:hypothetical protein